VLSRSCRQFLSCLVLAFVLLRGQAPASAQDVVVEEVVVEPGHQEAGITSLKQMQRLSERELECLYAQADAAPLPVGFVRGQVLFLSGRPLPRVGARVSGLVWKGKHFDEQGWFINQWTGFRAIASHATYGASWYDGRPCLVLQYPEGTALLGNMRDEVREIGPGVYLARVYERSPPRRFRGFIGLELEPPKRP
jgi:hypothetical protein